jgi:hypothetical protein
MKILDQKEMSFQLPFIIKKPALSVIRRMTALRVSKYAYEKIRHIALTETMGYG